MSAPLFGNGDITVNLKLARLTRKEKFNLDLFLPPRYSTPEILREFRTISAIEIYEIDINSLETQRQLLRDVLTRFVSHTRNFRTFDLRSSLRSR